LSIANHLFVTQERILTMKQRKTIKKLSLSKETVKELSDSQLVGVAGGVFTVRINQCESVTPRFCVKTDFCP
jgi:hypothetical protein